MDTVIVDGTRTPVQYVKTERLERLHEDLHAGYLNDRTETWLHPQGQCHEKRCRDAWRLRAEMEKITAELGRRTDRAIDRQMRAEDA